MAIRAESKGFGSEGNYLANSGAEYQGDEDLIRLYLEDIGRHPLLTKEEEVKLAQGIEAGRDAEATLESQSDQLTPKRIQELEEQAVEGRCDKQKFMNSNLRLVVSVARRYHPDKLEFLDLVQEGNFGLNRAIDKFDWRRGFKFSTYATWWINQAIQRAIKNTDRTIRLPVGEGDKIGRVRKERVLLTQELKRNPTSQELAERAAIDKDEIDDVIARDRTPASIDEPIENEYGGETDLSYYLADSDTSTQIEDRSDHISDQETVARFLSQLPDDEKDIISLRYGLVDGEPKSVSAVSQLAHRSPSTVRRLETDALEKIGELAKSWNLSSEDFN